MQQSLDIIGSLINKFNANNKTKQNECINSVLIDLIHACITNDTYNETVPKDCFDDDGHLQLPKVSRAKGIMISKIFQQLSTVKNEEISKLNKRQQEKLKQYIQSCVNKFFQPKLAELPNYISSSSSISELWCKYSSIENISTDITKRYTDYGLTTDKTKWAISEKVHGANFAIIYNGKEFGAAKLFRIFYRKRLFIFIT